MTEEQPTEWQQARELLAWMGRIPPSFTTPIRTLVIDQQNGGALAPATQFLVTRLLRSPSLKAILYYASLSLHGERIANTPYLSSIDILRLYAPGELAALFSFVFLYRKLRASDEYLLDEQTLLWESRCLNRLEAGYEVGRAIPKIGAARGMLAGAWRELMLGMFRRKDPSGFSEYLSYLSDQRKPFDPQFEVDRWGCTHVDVGSNALQLLGLGVGETHGFMQGFSGPQIADEKSHLEAYQYQIAAVWIDALLETGEMPERVHQGEYYPRQKDSYKLLYRINELRENGCKYSWLSCSKEDINPQSTPQLYQEYLLELQEAAQVEEFFQNNLPQDVLASLSEEDLKELASVR